MVNIVRAFLGLDEDDGKEIAKAVKEVKKKEKKVKKADKEKPKPEPVMEKPKKEGEYKHRISSRKRKEGA